MKQYLSLKTVAVSTGITARTPSSLFILPNGVLERHQPNLLAQCEAERAETRRLQEQLLASKAESQKREQQEHKLIEALKTVAENCIQTLQTTQDEAVQSRMLLTIIETAKRSTDVQQRFSEADALPLLIGIGNGTSSEDTLKKLTAALRSISKNQSAQTNCSTTPDCITMLFGLVDKAETVDTRSAIIQTLLNLSTCEQGKTVIRAHEKTIEIFNKLTESADKDPDFKNLALFLHNLIADHPEIVSKLCETEGAIAALLKLGNEAQNLDTKAAIAQAFRDITACNAGKEKLSTVAARDSLTTLGTAPVYPLDFVLNMAQTLNVIVSGNSQMQTHFAEANAFNMVVTLAHHATAEAPSAIDMTTVIYHIAQSEEGKTACCTAETIDALIELEKHLPDSEPDQHRKYIAYIVNAILNRNSKLLKTPRSIQLLINLGNVAYDDEFREWIAEGLRIETAPISLQTTCNLLTKFGTDTSSEEVRSAIARTIIHFTTSQQIVSAAFKIFSKKPEFRNMLVKIGKESTGEAARYIARAIALRVFKTAEYISPDDFEEQCVSDYINSAELAAYESHPDFISLIVNLEEKAKKDGPWMVEEFSKLIMAFSIYKPNLLCCHTDSINAIMDLLKNASLAEKSREFLAVAMKNMTSSQQGKTAFGNYKGIKRLRNLWAINPSLTRTRCVAQSIRNLTLYFNETTNTETLEEARNLLIELADNVVSVSDPASLATVCQGMQLLTQIGDGRELCHYHLTFKKALIALGEQAKDDFSISELARTITNLSLNPVGQRRFSDESVLNLLILLKKNAQRDPAKADIAKAVSRVASCNAALPILIELGQETISHTAMDFILESLQHITESEEGRTFFITKADLLIKMFKRFDRTDSLIIKIANLVSHILLDPNMPELLSADVADLLKELCPKVSSNKSKENFARAIRYVTYRLEGNKRFAPKDLTKLLYPSLNNAPNHIVQALYNLTLVQGKDAFEQACREMLGKTVSEIPILSLLENRSTSQNPQALLTEATLHSAQLEYAQKTTIQSMQDAMSQSMEEAARRKSNKKTLKDELAAARNSHSRYSEFIPDIFASSSK